jgi:hypothetical protein
MYNDIASAMIRGMCPIKVTSINGKSIIPDQPKCEFSTDISRISFDVNKYIKDTNKNCSSTGCVPNKIILCKGSVLCKEHPTFGSNAYNVTCIGNDTSCPMVEDCMADVFTSPLKDINKDVQNKPQSSSASKQGIKDLT